MRFKNSIIKATEFAGRIAQTFRNVNYPKAEVGKPSMGVVAGIGRDDIWGRFFQDILSNTDYILKQRASGKSYDFYTEMEEKDPKLYGLLRTRKKAVTGLPWDIIPFVSQNGAEPKNRDMKIASETKKIFQKISEFSQDKYELLDAIGKGFAVSEIKWNSNGYYGVEALKSRRQKFFVFDKDLRLRLLTDEQPLTGQIMPDRKFLVFCNEPYAESPYGNSVLKYCYWYWWFKKNAVKWWAIFAEKFGSPHIIAEHDPSLPPEEKDRLDDLISNFQNQTGARIPTGVVLKFLEAVRRGDAGYETFLNYCDDMNAVAILGQTLTSAEGRRSGSMALGWVHDEVRQDILVDDGRTLDTVMNQLVKWIVDYNWADVDGYPAYITNSSPPEDLKLLSEVDLRLFAPPPTGLGVPVSQKYLRQKYNIPEPQKDEDLLAIPSTSPIPEPPPGMSESLTFASKKRKLFQIGSTISLQEKLRRKLEDIYRRLEPSYLALLGENMPLKAAVDDMVRNHFDKLMRAEFNGATREAVIVGVQSIADRLGLKVNRGEYLKWVDNYLRHRVYEKGRFEEIGKTLTDLLHGKAKALYDQKLTVANIKDQLKAQFKDMADWKADMIARTEINSAANYGGIQMMKQSGLKVKAWFIVDPASCPICQDWAAMNPYQLYQAEAMGLPHPNCDDQWAFIVEE